MSADDLKQRVAGVLKLEASATPGPWFEFDDPLFKRQTGILVASTAPSKGNRIYADPPGGSYPGADTDLIVAMRNIFGELAAELDQRDAEIDRLRKDADRYRWMRNRVELLWLQHDRVLALPVMPQPDGCNFAHGSIAGHLDDMIDKALAPTQAAGKQERAK